MSEPNLIQTFAEIKLDMGEELGWTRTEGKWTASQILKMNSMIDAGYRRFLFSARTSNGNVHRWSFLEPIDTIALWPTTTGTVSGSGAYDGSTYTTITATESKFYATMVGKSFSFDTSSTEYTIASYVSATQIKVTGDASAEASDDTFTITADGDYRLPDDFGGIIGDMFYSNTNTYRRYLRRYGIAQINYQRSVQQDYTAPPEMYAIAPLTTDGTVGQRHEVSVWPTPYEVVTLTYQYSILPDKLTSSYPYPKGSEQFSESIRYACLAEVERRHGLQRGYEQMYQDMSNAAVQRDQLDNMPATLGYNGDSSVNGSQFFHDRTVGRTITRNGVQI